MVLFRTFKRQKDLAGLNAELNSDFQYIKKGYLQKNIGHTVNPSP